MKLKVKIIQKIRDHKLRVYYDTKQKKFFIILGNQKKYIDFKDEQKLKVQKLIERKQKFPVRKSAIFRQPRQSTRQQINKKEEIALQQLLSEVKKLKQEKIDEQEKLYQQRVKEYDEKLKKKYLKYKDNAQKLEEYKQKELLIQQQQQDIEQQKQKIIEMEKKGIDQNLIIQEQNRLNQQLKEEISFSQTYDQEKYQQTSDKELLNVLKHLYSEEKETQTIPESQLKETKEMKQQSQSQEEQKQQQQQQEQQKYSQQQMYNLRILDSYKKKVGLLKNIGDIYDEKAQNKIQNLKFQKEHRNLFPEELENLIKKEKQDLSMQREKNKQILQQYEQTFQDLQQNIQQEKYENLEPFSKQLNQLNNQFIDQQLIFSREKNLSQLNKKQIDLIQQQKQQLEQIEQQQGEGNGTNKKKGLQVKDLLRKIYQFFHDDDVDVNVITNQREKINFTDKQKKNIIIFLKDNHYTVAYYDPKQSSIFLYDPYGLQENYKKNEKQLQQFAIKISPSTNIKIKKNYIQHQEGGLNENDENDCGIYCLQFIHNIHKGWSFKDATNYDERDKKDFEKLKFDFI